MGARARAAVSSKFDFATVAARYVELCEQLLDRSGDVARWAQWEPWLRRTGLLALMFSGAFVWLTLAGFDWAVQATASLLSSDGEITEAGQRRLASWLSGGAIFSSVAGVLSLALSRHDWRSALVASFERDALSQRGLRVPNPYVALLASTAVALIVMSLWTFRAHLGAPVLFLFTKEGPLEHLTFVLELVAAVLCVLAAVRWNPRTAPYSNLIRGLYTLCGFGLFIVGMEEINWGQTLFGFQTPASWAAINYQQETSLHNLIDRDELNLVSKIVATVFGIGALTLMLWAGRTTAPVIGAIAPPTSLAALAVAVVYAGNSLHPEVLELLLAVFFAFYSWRIYVAARSSAGPWQLLQPNSDVPRMDAKRRWDTELLEYTHDAIIIWEMDGGGVLYWNRAAEQLYGYPRSQALGRVTHELLRTKLAGGVGQLERTLARFGVWVGELRHRARDGREVVVDARLAVLAHHSGRWLVLEVNRDLTDAKMAESQRDAAERQLTEWHGSHTPVATHDGPARPAHTRIDN
jgi:PAS domain S-box-containing protein